MSSRLDDRIREMMQRVVDESPPPPDLPIGPPLAPVPAWRLPNWAVAVGAAMAVIVLIGGVVWLIGGTGTDVIKEPIPTTLVPPDTTVPVTETTSPVVGAWNPILSTTVAREAPAAATCPDGTNPDVPGPVNQVRPMNETEVGVMTAVFDRRAGRVVYVDSTGETWTFDVCTNTWYQMHPTGGPIGNNLEPRYVYDVDSDVTVALGYKHISVYDANTNTWTHPANDGTPSGGIPWGAYDPVTGLIIASNPLWNSETDSESLEFWAYDVDSNEWTLVGPLDMEPEAQVQLDFLGYSEQLDRLIVARGVDGEAGTIESGTILVDPRTGDVTVLPIDSPGIDFFGWQSGTYGAADGTVYTTDLFDTPHDICGFDANVKSWTACFDIPDSVHIAPFPYPRLVGDPINNRLVVITSSPWGAVRSIGAIDFDTGEWTQLLSPSTP